MNHRFDEVPSRRETESIKWRFFDEDVLPMWVADMDFYSPEPVIRALRARVEHGVFGYPDDMPDLQQAIVERLERLYNWRVTPEDVVLVPGVVTGFNLACHAYVRPGGGVLMQTPVYPPFLSAPANAGLRRDEMQLTQLADGSYEIDFDAFEAAINDQTGMFILCNPHNPVGRVFRQDELARMAEICLRHNVLICSDEIHCDLIFDHRHHIPVATLDPEIARHSITLMAPSKTFNIAGLECSFAVIPDAGMRKQYQQARQGMVGGVNLMGLVAGLAAYRYGQPWLDSLLAYLQANRDWLYDAVHSRMPGVQMGRPEGTYLAWLDFRAAGLPGCPQEFFLKEGRVGLNDGATFGKGGEGFVRLNFGCPRSMLEETVERLCAAMERLGVSG